MGARRRTKRAPTAMTVFFVCNADRASIPQTRRLAGGIEKRPPRFTQSVPFDPGVQSRSTVHSSSAPAWPVLDLTSSGSQSDDSEEQCIETSGSDSTHRDFDVYLVPVVKVDAVLARDLRKYCLNVLTHSKKLL